MSAAALAPSARMWWRGRPVTVVCQAGRFVRVKVRRARALVVHIDELAAERPAAPIVPRPPRGSRRPITEPERLLIRRLTHIRFGAFNRKSAFVEQLATADQITDRQAWYVDLLAYQYRRQLAKLREPIGLCDHRVGAAPEGIEDARWADYNRKFNDLLMRGAG